MVGTIFSFRFVRDWAGSASG